MDLKIFFSPLGEEVYEGISTSNSFYQNIRINTDKMPAYKDADIAIIGVGEARGNELNNGAANAPDMIRKKLYKLKKGTGKYKIIDLGNIRPGVDRDETVGRLKEVCSALLQHNVLPLIIGGTHDLDYGQYGAYEDLEKLICFLNVDAFLDMDGEDQPTYRHHLQQILLHEPNYLFHYIHLAYQSYLIDPEELAILEKLYFETYRIGQVRLDMKEMEPIIRNADLLSFDITAIKANDAPANVNSQPFGLTGEEACQLCWYAGINEKLSSAGFYEYNPDLDDSQQNTAAVVATMIWYFIEGFYNRRKSTSFTGNDFIQYIVSMPAEPETVKFFKSKMNEKWWMEIPGPAESKKFNRNCVIPCSYSDYEMATKGELPLRYIQMHAKMI